MVIDHVGLAAAFVFAPNGQDIEAVRHASEP